MCRPNPAAPKAQREAFKTLCAEVHVRLRDEITEMRRTQRAPKKMAPKAKTRQKMGHA